MCPLKFLNSVGGLHPVSIGEQGPEAHRPPGPGVTCMCVCVWCVRMWCEWCVVYVVCVRVSAGYMHAYVWHVVYCTCVVCVCGVSAVCMCVYVWYVLRVRVHCSWTRTARRLPPLPARSRPGWRPHASHQVSAGFPGLSMLPGKKSQRATACRSTDRGSRSASPALREGPGDALSPMGHGCSRGGL